MPALEHATVADAMHPGVIACDPDASPRELARMMAAHHVHAIAVLGVSHGGSGDSLAWGMVSDLDVVDAAVHDRVELTAGELARRPTVMLEPAMALLEAGRLMSEAGAAHALIINPSNQHPVGVLSTLDLAGVFAWGEA